MVDRIDPSAAGQSLCHVMSGTTFHFLSPRQTPIPFHNRITNPLGGHLLKTFFPNKTPRFHQTEWNAGGGGRRMFLLRMSHREA